MNIQQHVIKYMENNNLNQYEMGDLLGLSQGTVSKIVNGGNLSPKNKENVIAFFKEKLNQDELIETTPIKPIIEPKTEKVYLESIEDLIAELKSGNTVYVDGTNKTIELVDGFIVRYDGFMQVSINGVILCSEKHYVIKEIPLKLEIGKKYVAKDGRIATVFAHTEADRFLATFEGDTQVRSYPSNGVLDNDDTLVKEY